MNTAAPPPAAGERLEPVAAPPDQLIYAMSQWTDEHPPDPELGYSDADMIELYNLVVSGCAATPAARAAVLEPTRETAASEHVLTLCTVLDHLRKHTRTHHIYWMDSDRLLEPLLDAAIELERLERATLKEKT